MSRSAAGLSPAGVPEEVVDQWRELAERRGSAFMLPEWFATWMRHYGEGASARVLPAFAADGALLGVMPMVLQAGKLRFAGANLGDHFAPVAAAEDEEKVAAAATDELDEARFMVLDRVDCGARWQRDLRVGARHEMRRIALRRDVLPYVDLRDLSWEDYLASRSRNLRSQVRRKTKKLERDHGAIFRRTTSAAELEADLDSFFELHDARWDPRGGSSLSTDRSREFHREFAALLLEHDWLRLWSLEIEGRVVASWYGWHIGGRYAYYLGGFSPDWEELSVGFVLLARTIRAATEEGAHEYDLLRGNEEYKSRFSTGEREVETAVLVPAGSVARLAVSTEARLWELSQRLPDGVRSAGQRVYSALPGSTATTRSDR